MPFQSEKQRRYLWANEPKIARDWADTYGSRIKKSKGGAMSVQGGVDNYLGDQKTVSGVPVKWKSRPGKPETELAYITKAEKDLILKKDLHGSLKDGPNKGPGGIISLDSAGGSWSGTTSSGSSNKGSDRQPGMNVHTQAQKKQQTKDVKNLQAAMKGQGSGSGAGDYVKMQQHLEDPRRHDPPEIKKTFKDKFQQKTSDYRKKELRKLFDHIYGGRKMQFPSMSALTRKADWDDEEYLEFANMSPMEFQARLGTDFSMKDIDKMREIGQALGQGNLSQTGKFKGDNKFAFEDFYPNVNQQSAGGGGGGGQGGGYTGPTLPYIPGEDLEKPEDPISDFQKSLTTGANNPFDYYVGGDPSAKNLAWGKQMGVDPRTMGLTSFAADGGRIPAAFGGIMDSSTGRRAYGLGSIFKKVGRAAKKVFKSPIGKAALLGLGGYYLGGGQGLGGSGMFGTKFGKNFALKNLMNRKGAGFLMGGGKDNMYEGKWNPWKIGIGALGALPFFMGGEKDKEDEGFDYEGAKNVYQDEIMRLRKGVKAGNLTDEATQAFLPVNYGQAEGGRIGYYAGGQSTPSDYTMEDARKTSMQDKMGGVTETMKRADLHRQGDVGQMYMANGGSADDKLMARIKELQDEGLDYNSAMAQALKELSSGKAQGGRIGYAGGSGRPPVTMGQAPQVPPQMPAQPPQAPQRPNPMPAPQPNRMGGMPGGMNPMMGGMPGGMNPMMNRPMMNPMMRGMPAKRIGRQEGGLMDLGGMEKDYRNDGGFVPLGGKEKADDVPARLSKNEFVFTADAVRGAGDGDIDKGAEIMENIMKNLEQGGQISEETQGLSGAQEMFDVSERLSEVV